VCGSVSRARAAVAPPRRSCGDGKASWAIQPAISGHGSGGSESVLAAVHKAGRDLVSQVPDHGSVHVVAPNSAIRLSERLHHTLDGVTLRRSPALAGVGRRTEHGPDSCGRRDALRRVDRRPGRVRP
jgi:hypothetical protein